MEETGRCGCTERGRGYDYGVTDYSGLVGPQWKNDAEGWKIMNLILSILVGILFHIFCSHFIF